MLREAVRHGLLARNVAADQPPPKAEGVAKVEIVDAEQIPELLAKLKGDPFEVPVIVSLYCGCGAASSWRMRWSDMDLDGARMSISRALEETTSGVRIKETKTESGTRTISLPQVVVQLLRGHRLRQQELRLALGAGRMPEHALVFPAPSRTPTRARAPGRSGGAGRRRGSGCRGSAGIRGATRTHRS